MDKQLLAEVKAALYNSNTDPPSTTTILSHIHTTLSAPSTTQPILYHPRFLHLCAILNDAHTDYPTSVDASMVIALSHLLHCVHNTGWLFRHMNLHAELHKWETDFEIPAVLSDPKDDAAEREYRFMKKNVEYLKMMDAITAREEIQARGLELDPVKLVVDYGAPLGGAGFAKVFKGTNLGKPVAVKQVFGGLSV
ncbi:hypothetical protein HDV00_001976 [Rhizophlyctis rosea]|nr:hypothetical protein HDV00_001976 [Rhizophlyctis rosea]